MCWYLLQQQIQMPERFREGTSGPAAPCQPGLSPSRVVARVLESGLGTLTARDFLKVKIFENGTHHTKIC
jgi:hypothetical protein